MLVFIRLHLTSYLFSQCFHRCDVDTATFCIVQQHPQNSKLSTDGLSTAGGSSHKHIIITVVHSIEDWVGTETTQLRQASNVKSTYDEQRVVFLAAYLVSEWG